MDVTAWLRDLGLERYAQAFHDAEVTPEVLPELTEADLEKLGLPLGPRKVVLKAVRDLAGPPATAAAPAEAGPDIPPVPSGAERRQLTVLFCDLVGSTELAARLDPEDMGALIRVYQDAVAAEVARFEGHVAKFMGDGVLAYFGWPKAHEDEAERAVRVGLALVGAVGGLATPAGEPLACRVGIATGLVVVGELVGSGAAREWAVVGETPNLAARLQALAERNAVVISRRTRHLVGGLFELQDLGEHRLKGFGAPVRASRVLGPSAAESRFDARHRTASLTSLVGREEELALLLQRWELAKGGEGQVALLAGEPGIGKSRLLHALRERLGDERYVALSHHCSPYHANSALHPVVAQLERAARLGDNEPSERQLDKLEAILAPAAGDAGEVAPLLAELLSIPTGGRYPPLSLSPQRRKERTLQALVDQLAGLAARHPVLAVYEDVHWVDPSTLELLGLVVDRVQRLPALVVITFRPEFQPPWTGRAHVTLLTLRRLGRRQGAALVERVTGKALPGEVVEQVVAKTDGVPLFVEELTKAVLESGLLRDEGERYALAGPLPALAIPATLHDSLLARLDRLAPVKEVAQIGAAIGREFSHQLLVAVRPMPDDALRGALNQLIEAELIFRRGAVYTFKHALVRDAAYESLLKAKRLQLHARIAAVLEERFPKIVETEPELLAQHYTEAGLAQPAIDYWLRAGEHAARRSAHLEAVAHLRKGLALLGALPDPADRIRREIELQAALGMALFPLKGQAASEVGAAYAKAAALCEQTGETAKLYPVLQGLWRFHVVRAEIGRSRELAERCYAMARRGADPTFLMAAHFVLCGSLSWAGEFGAARDHFDGALRIGNRAQRRPQALQGLLLGVDLQVFLQGVGCHAVWHLGYPEQAIRSGDDAVTLARQAGEPFSLALALDYAAMLRQFGRDHRAAEELALAAMELCSEHHFAYYLAWATIIQGWAVAAGGQVDDGIVRMRRGLADLEATGGRLRRPYYLALLADAHVDAGRPAEGLEIVGDAIASAETTGERWRDADLQRIRGRLLLALSRERAAEAEACLRKALEIARKQDARAIELQAGVDLARLWRDQGRRAEARGLLAPVYGWFTEGFDTKDLREAKALLDDLG